MCLESILYKIASLEWFDLIIDVNNVAYFRNKSKEKPSLEDVLLLIDYAKNKFGVELSRIHCICDPSLRYYIDKPNEFQILIEEGVIIEAPKLADEMILSFALKYEFCFIVSNDKFRDYYNQLPSKEWLEDRRISFMIIGDEVCLSPNIPYDRIKLLKKNKIVSRKQPKISTLDVLHKIEQTEGKFELF